MGIFKLCEEIKQNKVTGTHKKVVQIFIDFIQNIFY